MMRAGWTKYVEMLNADRGTGVRVQLRRQKELLRYTRRDVHTVVYIVVRTCWLQIARCMDEGRTPQHLLILPTERSKVGRGR